MMEILELKNQKSETGVTINEQANKNTEPTGLIPVTVHKPITDEDVRK